MNPKQLAKLVAGHGNHHERIRRLEAVATGLLGPTFEGATECFGTPAPLDVDVLTLGSGLVATQTGSGLARVDVCYPQGAGWALLNGVHASTVVLPASGQVDVGWTLFDRSDDRFTTNTDTEGDTGLRWSVTGPVHAIAGVQIRNADCTAVEPETSASMMIRGFNSDGSTAYGLCQSWYGPTEEYDSDYWLANAQFMKRSDMSYLRLVVTVINKTAGDLCVQSAYLSAIASPGEGPENVY